MKKRIGSLLLLGLIVLGTTTTVNAANYGFASGTVDGQKYTISVDGNTTDLTASTSLSTSKVTSRSVSIVGTYVGSSFTGTKKTSMGNGSASLTTVKATIFVSGDNRFISYTSTHSFDGYTKTLSNTVK